MGLPKRCRACLYLLSEDAVRAVRVCLFGYDKGGGKLFAFFHHNITCGDPIRVEEYFLRTGEALSCNDNFLRVRLVHHEEEES